MITNCVFPPKLITGSVKKEVSFLKVPLPTDDKGKERDTIITDEKTIKPSRRVVSLKDPAQVKVKTFNNLFYLQKQTKR